MLAKDAELSQQPDVIISELFVLWRPVEHQEVLTAPLSIARGLQKSLNYEKQQGTELKRTLSQCCTSPLTSV